MRGLVGGKLRYFLFGSTFDSTTSYDGQFEQGGDGTIGIGYSRGLQGFTVRVAGC